MTRQIPDDIVRRILDARLQLELSLDREQSAGSLCRAAKMSAFHFQRKFRQVVGESVAQHVRRLRLERAALWLRNSVTPVIEIALGSGFESHAGFTHAFTNLYGMSPTSYRDGHDVRPFIRQRHEGRPIADADALARCPLTVSLSDLPDRLLAVMRFAGPTHRLPTVWPKMMDWCRRRDLLCEDAVFLGLHHDDWESTQAGQYRYDAAIVVPPDIRPDGEVTLFRQAGGLVASTQFSGSLVEMDRTWQMFVRQWLPASGFQFRLTHVYDVYPPGLLRGSLLQSVVRSLTGISATLCIPISRDWEDTAPAATQNSEQH